MDLKSFNRVSSTFFVVVFSIILAGCMAFSNKQLAAQFEGMDVNISEDERGLIITLPTVYFDFDSSNLKASSRDKIAQIASVLNHKRAKNRNIEIEGHSDNIGDPNYNLTLSAERAEVVLKELAFSNIDETRMASTGKGETSPVADNSTSEGRRTNRRVEIIVLNP